jgi:histidinol-phosphate aminotransferase
MVISLNENIQRYIVNKRKGYVEKEAKETEDCHDCLRFDLGESDFGMDKALLSRIEKIDIHSLSKRYPSASYSTLISKIAAKYCLNHNNVVVGPGANELIERISRVFLNKGEICLVIHPTFYRFEDSSLRQTDNIIHIYLDKNNGFEWSEETVSAVRRHKEAKIVWICNPINPTGHLVPPEFIRDIVESMQDSIVVVDEAYGDYVSGWEKKSSRQLLNGNDNLIVLKTLSKYFGIAGLRFGYALSSEQIINALKSIQLEFDITGVTQKIVESLLETKDPNKELAGIVELERTRVLRSIDLMKNIEYVDSKTNIIILKHKKKDLFNELKKHKILTTCMNNCRGIDNMGYTRLTIQTNSEMNKKLVGALRQID